MDKQFVNIDDLVRQRLSGGEEQEQAGSWGRMRDLLDKEMPQRPAGLFWRRSLSALALLLLAGAAGVGGYRMYTAKEAGNTTANEIAMATGNEAANSSSAHTITNTKNISTLPAGNNDNNNKNGKDNNNKVNTAAVATTNDKKINDRPTATHSSIAHASDVANDHRTANNNTSTPVTANTADHTASAVADNHAAPKATGSVDNTPVASVANHHTAPQMKDKKVVAGNTVAANTVSDAKRTNNAGTTVTHTAAKSGGSSMAHTVARKNEGVATVSDNNTTVADHTADAAKAIASADNNKKTTAKEHKSTAHTQVDKLALSSNTPSAVVPVSNPLTVTDKKAVKQTHRPVASKAVAARHTVVKEEADVATVTDNNSVADNKPQPKSVKKSSRQSAPVAMNNMPLSAGTATVAAKTANTTTTAGNPVRNTRKAQRQVERLVLAQRFVLVGPNRGEFHLDTIAMETVTEEYEVAANSIIPFGPQPYADVNEPEVASSSTSSSSTTLLAKETKNMKKVKGSGTMENLHAAFNDIKDKAHGVRFAPGITAGVNGSFFGPSSFKGFQFGMTGNFTFSNTLSVMTELKYFHRINNSYTLSDNYYNYTPVAGGGYTKELVVNPYNFSTLHSLELPVSVRYCVSNFNFYVGGSVAYIFGVNTGAAPLPDPTNVTQVATMENDNAPKIRNGDFDARLGIGYLVGASYQAAPNVMFDLRSVQNVWDNGQTTGAKYVSNQLYKSPSLQLSLIYRLGGRKDKEK